MELSFEMNACERLEQEIKNETQFNKALGEFLLENLKKDKALEMRYHDKKMTLKGLGQYVMKQAKAYLKNQNGAIEDKVVFGWVLHYVQDEIVEPTKKESVVYQDPIVMRPQVQKEPIKKVKKKKEPKDNGQLNLFDFCEGK